MKKLVAVAVVAALTVAGAVAQVTVGVRGNVGLNVGTTFAPKEANSEYGIVVPYGAGAYVRYNMPFYSPVGVEFDFDFGMNQGLKQIWTFRDDTWTDITYNAIDLALLGTYSMNFDAFGITFVAGPYMSLPSNLVVSGYVDNKLLSSQERELVTSIVYGIKAGVEGSYKVGPGNVVVGLNYVNDFNPITFARSTTEITRRNLNLSVGYAIQF